MTDELERRLRAGLHGADLPPAPESLRAALDNLPHEAGPIGTGGQRLRLGWVMPALVVIVVLALIAAWLPGGLLGPAGPTVSPRGLPSRSAGVPSPSSTLATGPEVDDFGLFDAQHGWTESNGHLYLTVDDGATWTDQGSIGSDYYATITFASPDVAFAQSGPLFERTTDAGRTWEPMVLPPHAGTVASFSFLTPTNGYLLMSASGNGPGTLLSTSDAGLVWQVVASTPAAVVGGIRFSDAQDGWAVGTREPFPPTGRPTLDALFVTRDGGHSWQETTIPVPAGYQTADLQEVSGLPSPAGDGAYEVSAEYLNTARLAWVTEYLVTTDAGATWQAHGTLAGQDNGPIALFDAQHWLAFLATPDGSAATFYTTDDAGGTWSPLSPSGLPPGFFVGYALRFADRQHGWAIVDGITGDIGGNINLSQQLYGTSDGGQTWHLLFGPQSASPSDSPTAASPSPVDQVGTFPGGGLWAVDGSTLLLSTDAGSSWRRTTIPTSTSAGPTVFVLDLQHAWSLTIGPGSTENAGSSTDVMNVVVDRTTDGGLTWQASAVPANLADTSPALVFADALHGYLVASAQRQSFGTSTIARTDDGGATWSVVGSRSWLGALVAASDASTIWAGGQQEAGGQFLQPILDVSRDGGRTWQDARLPGLAGQDEAQCGCYLAGPPLFTDPATGYVTVISGAVSGPEVTRIDRTTDGGHTWTVMTDQPLGADAGVGVLDPAHWLLLVGYPAELLGTADGGASWHKVAAGGFPSDQFTWIAGMDAHHAAALRFINGPDHSLTAPYLSADGGATWLPADLGGVTPSTQPPSPPTPTAALPPTGSATAIAFVDAETGHGAHIQWTHVTGLTEAASAVTITVNSFVFEPGAMTDEADGIHILVHLRAPLNSRTVIDGSTGQPIAATG